MKILTLEEMNAVAGGKHAGGKSKKMRNNSSGQSSANASNKASSAASSKASSKASGFLP